MKEMTKKSLLFLVIGCLTFGLISSLQAEETKIGGHIKLSLYDTINGTHNGISGNETIGMGFSEFILYLSQELTDKVSVDVQQYWSASTGATPAFGYNIGEQREATHWELNPATGVHEEVTTATEWGLHGMIKAVVKTVLPDEYELSVGIVHPRFTWEYGAQIFWEDEYNGGKFACNPYLADMGGTGLEVYKSFELGEVSLPLYGYVLNGGSAFNDTNGSALLMLRAEPEIGPLRLAVSLATGKYDASATKSLTRYAVGAAYETGPFSVRAEYAGGTWEKSISGTDDATPSGYYAKLFYRFADWGKLMLHYDYVANNYTGFFYTAAGSEKYTTITPGLQLYVSDSSIIQIQYDIADWQQKDRFGIPGNDDTIEFNRLTMGWRTTF